MPGGRPTIYTQELADEICNTIASSSKSIKKLCKERDHWPADPTIWAWIDKYPEFSSQYVNAKRKQIQVYIEEIIEISDDNCNDTTIKTNSHGEEYEVCNSEWLGRSRLRVDTRKWLASKLLPKLYGEKVNVALDDETKEKIGMSVTRVKDADSEYNKDH